MFNLKTDNGMRILFVLEVLILLISASCSQKSDNYKALENVDSILFDYDVEKAKEVFEGIDSSSLVLDRDKAYYSFLHARIYEPQNSEALNFALNYYTNVNDIDGIAYCCLYKGRAFYSINNDSAAWYYKSAVHYATQTTNRKLRYLSFWALGVINNSLGDCALALQCYKNQCDEAKYLRNTDHDVALVTCARSYMKLSHNDSAWMCISQVVDPESLPVSVKPYFYNWKGELLIDTDRETALQLFEKSVMYRYWERSYRNLSRMYYELDRKDEADNLIRKIMDSSCYEVRIEITDMLINEARNNGALSDALGLYEQKCLLMDSLMDRKDRYRVVESQMEYEAHIEIVEYHNRVLKVAVVAILVVSLMAILIVLGKYRNISLRRKVAENQITIYNLQSEIAELESLKGSQEDIDVLEARLRELKKDSEEGAKLFEWVNDNKTIQTWTKYDIESLLEYCCACFPQLTKDIETNAHVLTYNEKFFLLLETLGKTDSQMSKILAVSVVTIRVKRSRIRQKCNL